MDLRLLNKLQASDTVSLILKNNPGEVLDYYIIGQTVSHSVICCGKCSGVLDKGMACFNIRMASISPLIDKGYNLVVKYDDGELRFVTGDERIEITPLYVEYRDPNAAALIEKYLKFNSALERRAQIEEELDNLQNDLVNINAKYSQLTMMHLSGGPSSDPFSEDKVLTKLNSEHDSQMQERQKKMTALQKEVTGLEELDFSEFANIALAASRAHEVVNFCDDYAIATLKGAYLIQKGKCPVMSLTGQLLNDLIRDSKGKGFYFFDDELVYLRGGKDKTAVFVAKYLPNMEVDSSILTRGVVEEKYTITLKSALDLVSIVKSKFPDFQMNMGEGKFRLSNSNGEVIEMNFDVEDARTIQLTKMMRGEQVKNGITMAVIDIPKSVHSVLGLFKNRLVVFVKKNKIVFQNEGLYLVFGR